MGRAHTSADTSTDAVDAATDYGTFLDIGTMLDSDENLMAKEELNAHDNLDSRVLNFISDMSEGNPSIIHELCKSIREADVCDFGHESCTMKEGRSLQECKLNTKLRHMALREFGTLPLHEQLISKMASVYTREFSTGMLQTHVAQHQRDHEDTFINLKKCVNQLLKADIFTIVRMPSWMASADPTAENAMIFRSKLMQKAVSELLLESHVTSVARSIKSASHARRISAFWLQKAVDHENEDGTCSGSSKFIEEYLQNVPARHRMSVDAEDLDLLEAMERRDEEADTPATAGRRGNVGGGMGLPNPAHNKIQRTASDLGSTKECEEEEEEEEEEDGPWHDGVDRSKIIRNKNGKEEPNSQDPELWNVDGTEVDFNQKYKFGGQLWYVQSRVQESAFKGTPINGIPMNEKARVRAGLNRDKSRKSLREILLSTSDGGGEEKYESFNFDDEKSGSGGVAGSISDLTLDVGKESGPAATGIDAESFRTQQSIASQGSIDAILVGDVDMEKMISPVKEAGGGSGAAGAGA
jgi:hypothetical protein